MGTQTLAAYNNTGIILTTAGAYQTPFTITQTGTVDVASGNAVDSGAAGAFLRNAGSISAPLYGVRLQAGGTVNNTSTGIITGHNAVVLTSPSGAPGSFTDTQSLYNAGTILGSNDGVLIQGSVSTLMNIGSISGTSSGVQFYGGGSIANAGYLYGGYAVNASDSPATAFTFSNTGTIIAGFRGVVAHGGGNQTIVDANMIIAPVMGIDLSNSGVAADTVVNTGTILSTQIGVYANSAAGAAGNQVFNFGSIQGTSDGVEISAATGTSGTLFNYGTLTGQTGANLLSPGDLADGGSAALSLVNSGLISATSNGVFLQGSLASIENTSTIYGKGDAIYLVGGGSIANAGTLAGAYAGVHWVDDLGTALTLNNTGTIYGGTRGVLADDDGNSTIANAKFIFGGFTGITVFNSGAALDTVVNTGTIASSDFAIFDSTLGNAAIFNSGIIEGGGTGVQLDNSGASSNTLVNSGTIANTFSGVYIAVNASGGGVQSVINRGTISGQYGIGVLTSASSGTTIENAGTIASTRGASGFAIGTFGADTGPLTLIIDPGAVFIGNVEAASAASNTLELGAGNGSLTGIGSQFTDFTTIAFNAGAAWTISGDTFGLAAGQNIDGFHRHDTIDLSGFAASAETFAGGILTLSNGGLSEFLSIAESPAVTSADFFIQSDEAGGTDITTDAICYVRGTRILTPTGEVLIEDLAIGDMVMTRFGAMQKIRWIGQQKFDWRFIRNNQDKIPVRIAPSALGENMPARELAISPGHSLLIGDTLVLARDLVNGVTITQDFNPIRDTGILEYYQIELTAHDCIVAQGCWAETFADAPGLRAQFHNAASYHALYPEAPPPEELCLCAARPQHGPELAAALLPVIARAWAGLEPGGLDFWIEHVTDWRVEGWALDTAHPTLPVILEVWLGDRLLGTTLARADAPRPDLAQAGKGNGRCAFSFALPVRLAGAQQPYIRRQGAAAESPPTETQPALTPARTGTFRLR